MNEESCTFKSRYCDFFSLASSIVNSENWKDFSLQDLYLSIDSLVFISHINTCQKLYTLTFIARFM